MAFVRTLTTFGLSTCLLLFSQAINAAQVNPTYKCKTQAGLEVDIVANPSDWQQTHIRQDLYDAFAPGTCDAGGDGVAVLWDSVFYFWVGISIATGGEWTPCDGTATLYYVTSDDVAHWKHTRCSRTN